MFLNYLRLSIRLLGRNPFFTVINVFGLAAGFAVFFILWPFTQSELEADRFIKDHDRIFRIVLDWNWSEDGGETWGHVFIGNMPSHIGPEMYKDGRVESYTRFLTQPQFTPPTTSGLKSTLVVSVEGDGGAVLFNEKRSIVGDPNFFEFFELPFVSGERKTALVNRGSVVISESLARKYFGHTDVVSKLIRVNDMSFMVTGVFQDIPENSHLEVDLAFTNAGEEWWDVGHQEFTNLYCKQSESGPDLTEVFEQNKEKLLGYILTEAPYTKGYFRTQPISEIAYSHYNNDTFRPRSKFILRILATVSMAVLIMAWMNYLNLTISRTKSRFKEIAARKMTGAAAKDLFLLFTTQAVVINVIAIAVGATFIQLLKHPFHVLFQINVIPLSELGASTIVFFMVIFIAGIVITSSYATITSLRYTTSQLIRQANISPRNFIPSVLTTVQYTAAFVLISLMLVSHSQLKFIMSRDLGIEKESIVVIDGPVFGTEGTGVQKLEEFTKQVELSTGLKASISTRVSGDNVFTFEVKGGGALLPIGLDCHGGVDQNFVPLYGLSILAGRNFEANEDPNSILLSAFATERLGFKTPADAIGAKLTETYGSTPMNIVGVVSDYRVNPLLYSTGNSEDLTGRGIVLLYHDNQIPWFTPERLSVKIAEGGIKEFASKVGKLYADMFPGNPFTWHFVDENINRHYQDQEVTRNRVSFFTLLALGVACLGLLGMIANKIVDKTKEMCIRKIIGAKHSDVVVLLLGSTIRQVVIAVAIGLPIASYLSNSYLSRFTEQIALQWWYYFVPVLIMMLLMLATIASVIWKALITNPVDALKQE